MIIVIVLLALTVLRVVLLTLGASLLIHPVRDCPACWLQTISIRKRVVDRLMRPFEVRWCPHCRWRGLARRQRPASRSIGIVT